MQNLNNNGDASARQQVIAKRIIWRWEEKSPFVFSYTQYSTSLEDG